MTLLIYDRAMLDPRMGKLHDDEYWTWMCLISSCARNKTTSLTQNMAREAIGDDFTDSLIARLATADLIRAEQDNTYTMLAYGDLWAIEDDDAIGEPL